MWRSGVTMNDPSARIGRLHVGYPHLIGYHECAKKRRCPTTPYTSRISRYDLDHELHQTPIEPFTSSSFLSPLPRVACTTATSSLERLPDEITLEIISYLDIASLVRFAECNSDLRSLIVGLRHVQIAKSHTYIWSAVLEMLNAGTARFFTLDDFVSMLTTSKCMICKDSDAFAPWVCLMLCERVCGKCIKIEQKNIRLPQSVASKCLGLNLSDMVGKAGTASVSRQPKPLFSGRFSKVGCRAWWTMRGDNRLDIIPLRLAVKLSLEKHAQTGGASHVKKLIQAYISQNDPSLLSRGQLNAITDECDVRGLTDLIVNLRDWKQYEDRSQDSIPSWILTGYMPFLHSAVLPLQLEPGLLCEGCERIAFHTRLSPAYAAAAAAAPAEKSYLSAQYEVHFQHCDAAQSISKGQRFKISDEEQLREQLSLTLSRFDTLELSMRDHFLRQIRRIDFDRTPLEVCATVRSLLLRIDEIGNRCLQQRTSSRQVESSTARRLGR
ncbi:hypothetical protein GJ744_006244 [Endocarpon pusillum]|uniref:F-box domain-containing protein n=1 Tax=Endocarpon pusillum TaxID=364733 RepID=A0A8H7AM89_9EURO|nr:hypothetical protein GJ744_006244 [Endocarpon pusillum]